MIPREEEAAARGAADDDRRLARVLDEASLWAARFGWLLLDNLEMARDGSVLDIGCGNGFPLLELAYRHGRAGLFCGLDIWQGALLQAAEKRVTLERQDVGLMRGDGERMPFRDACFDLVVSNVGVNNFADPWIALEECGRVTRAGGRIALTTNPVGHMEEFYAAYRDTLVATGRARFVERLEQEAGHRPSREELEEMLAHGGFSVERVIEDSFRLRFLDGAAFMGHPLVRLGFLEGWRSVLDDERDRDEVLAALAKRLDEEAARAGELSFRVPMLYVEGARD